MNEMECFSKRLKELRKEKQLSQESLANELGIAKGSYNNYEIGKRVPDIRFLVSVANFFNVSTEYLFGKTDAKTPEKVDVCSYLGISESSFDNIKTTTSKQNSIDLLLESEELPYIANALINIQNVISVKYYHKYIVGSLATVFKDYEFDDTEITTEAIKNPENASHKSEKLCIFQLFYNALISAASENVKQTVSLLKNKDFRTIQETLEFSLTRSVIRIVNNIEHQERSSKQPTKARRSFHQEVKKCLEDRISVLEWGKPDGYEREIKCIKIILDRFDELFKNCIPPKNNKKMLLKEEKIWQQLTDLDTTDMETS